MADRYEDEQPEAGYRKPKSMDPLEASRMRKVFSKREHISPTTGFRSLEATAYYSPSKHLLTLVVTARTDESNRGPGIFYKKTFPWERKLNAGEAGKLVVEELAVLRRRITNRELPERGLFLEKCNTAGEPTGTFLESVCSKCACWYCEVAS